MAHPPAQPRPLLVSAKLCPFVQRAVIVLEVKGVVYDVRYVDLDEKPAWFLAMSPLGKVPLLEVDGTVLFESSAIMEYLDEAYGAARLHPEDPLERALHRGTIELLSQATFDNYRLTIAQTPDELERARDALKQKLVTLEEFLAKKPTPGPFFGGEVLALVDAAAAPLLQRCAWLELVDPALGLLSHGARGHLERVARCQEALLGLREVQRSLPPEAGHLWLSYLRGRGSPGRRQEPSLLARRLGEQDITLPGLAVAA